MSEKKIILMGGGGHCRSCIDVIESSHSFTIAGIVERPGSNLKGLFGYPVIGSDNELDALKKQYDYALVTVGQTGSSIVRQKLFNRLKQSGFILPVVSSSLAYISPHAQIGEGAIIMHQAIVNAGARIGENCILNTRCLIEHDSKVGDHTHVSTGVVSNGGTQIGSNSFVGSNATIVQGVALPDNYYFKAGTLIRGEKQGEVMKDNRV
ncbi:MAG: acetyltransferase [Desulfobacteraceae bacterium]|nr:acetyltransferase [Desulfobacteraceae bacterium]